MGAQGKKTAPAGPTRRKVLVTALATAAGVAGARILGLRNLDASESPGTAMDAADMSMATGMAEAPDGSDWMVQHTNRQIVRIAPDHTMTPVVSKFEGKRFDSVDRRFDSIDRHLEAHDQRMDRMEGRFEQRLGSRFNTIQASIDAYVDPWLERDRPAYTGQFEDVRSIPLPMV